MSAPPSPLATPTPWANVADGYVTDLVPLFERYARDALRLAELPLNARVVDVAAGPGTLSLLAARAAEHVDALDFSPAMLEHLERRAAAEGITNVTAHAGDGQALPFEDGAFDAAFSMFGLIFFPDRARGFRELHRVLATGGRAVVSSWAPMDRVPLMVAMFTAMNEELPGMLNGTPKLPLSDPDEFRAEMEAAGFQDVVVHDVAHQGSAESIDSYWRSNVRSSAPIALIRSHMEPSAFAAFSQGVSSRLTAQFGEGPVAWEFVAHLGVGRKAG